MKYRLAMRTKRSDDTRSIEHYRENDVILVTWCAEVDGDSEWAFYRLVNGKEEPLSLKFLNGSAYAGDSVESTPLFSDVLNPDNRYTVYLKEKMNLLSDERIRSFVPGSFISKKSPMYVPKVPKRRPKKGTGYKSEEGHVLQLGDIIKVYSARNPAFYDYVRIVFDYYGNWVLRKIVGVSSVFEDYPFENLFVGDDLKIKFYRGCPNSALWEDDDFMFGELYKARERYGKEADICDYPRFTLSEESKKIKPAKNFMLGFDKDNQIIYLGDVVKISWEGMHETYTLYNRVIRNFDKKFVFHHIIGSSNTDYTDYLDGVDLVEVFDKDNGYTVSRFADENVTDEEVINMVNGTPCCEYVTARIPKYLIEALKVFYGDYEGSVETAIMNYLLDRHQHLSEQIAKLEEALEVEKESTIE